MRKHTCIRLGFIVVSDFVVYLHISRSCNAVFVVCCLWLFHLVVSCCRSFYSLFMSLLRREEEKKETNPPTTELLETLVVYWKCRYNIHEQTENARVNCFSTKNEKNKAQAETNKWEIDTVILMFYQLFSTHVFEACTQFSSVLFCTFVIFCVHVIKFIGVKYSGIRSLK